LQKAKLPPLGNVDLYAAQNVRTHTVGTKAGTPLVNGAAQNVTYDGTNAQNLVTNGWTASAPRLKKGDVFTIAGVFAVNPVSKLDVAVSSTVRGERRYLLGRRGQCDDQHFARDHHHGRVSDRDGGSGLQRGDYRPRHGLDRLQRKHGVPPRRLRAVHGPDGAARGRGQGVSGDL
jgi:hypothetical protein